MKKPVLFQGDHYGYRACIRSGWFALLAAAGVLLAACQTLDSSTGYYAKPVTPGSQVEVLQVLQVPAGLARVYLQYGTVVRYTAVDQYAPFCYFLLQAPLPHEQPIHPAVFGIENVYMDETDVRLALPVQVAVASDAGRGPIAYRLYMALASAQNADVRALVCLAAFDAPYHARPVTLDDIRLSLGALARIRVKSPVAR